MNRSALLLLAALCAGEGLVAQATSMALQNGVDGYLQVPYSPQVVPQTGLTVEAWVIYDDSTLPSGWRYPTVLRQNLNAGTEGFFLRINANNTNDRVLRFKVETANSEVSVDWPFQPGRLMQWTHLAGTYDGSMARLYVDGIEVASRPGIGEPITDRGGVLNIGKGSDIGGPIEVWNGNLDEVRMWPFARTAAEILATKDLALSSMPGLVSTWNLDSGGNDSSSTLNATVNGAVTWSPNTPGLQQVAFLGTSVGASTPSCGGPITAAVASLARPGARAFGMVAHGGPPNAIGATLIGFQAHSQPVQLLGVDLWVDFTTGLAITFSADALGTARTRVPVPPNAPIGATVLHQMIYADPCGAVGLTASDALASAVVN